MKNKKIKVVDNVKRNQFGKCVVCGDTAITKQGNCYYCEWKGLSGAGKQLKNIIAKNK